MTTCSLPSPSHIAVAWFDRQLRGQLLLVPPDTVSGIRQLRARRPRRLPGFGRVRRRAYPRWGIGTRGEHATAWRTDRAASRRHRRQRCARSSRRDRRGVRRVRRRLPEPPHRAQRRRHLGDQQRRRASSGRLNKPIGQADGALFADPDDNLDIVQQDAAVVGVNLDRQPAHAHRPVDRAAGRGRGGDDPARRRGRAWPARPLAVLDPADGRVWAQRDRPPRRAAVRQALADAAEPLGEVGETAALTVTTSGAVLAASAESDRLVRLRADGRGLRRAGRASAARARPRARRSPSPRSASGPCVLDAETGGLVVVGGGTRGAAARHGRCSSPARPPARCWSATRTELLDVDLETGDATAARRRPERAAHRTGAPRRLRATAPGPAAAAPSSPPAAAPSRRPATSVSDATDLVFRVNRGEILLNDRASGAVWDLDTDSPARIDDWDAFLPDQVEQDDSDQEQEDQDAGDRQPPKAKPDDFGARPGRITVLHPLDNDTAPSGRILAIRSVDGASGPGTLVDRPRRPDRPDHRCRPTRSARPPSTTSSTTGARTSPTRPR